MEWHHMTSPKQKKARVEPSVSRSVRTVRPMMYYRIPSGGKELECGTDVCESFWRFCRKMVGHVLVLLTLFYCNHNYEPK